MNILIFSTHPEGDNRISKHISTLLKKRFEIKYINSSFSCNKTQEQNNYSYKHINIECYPKKKPISYIFILSYFLIQLIINHKYKHLHIHDNYLLPITLFAKIFRKKIYYDKHEYYEKVSYIHYFYEKVFSRFVDKYILVTEGQIDFLPKYKDYVIIPNYQSKYFYSLIKQEKNRLLTITYIGSLSPTDREIDSMLNIFIKLSTLNIKIIFGGRNLPKSYYSKIDYLKKINKNFTFIENLNYHEVAYYTKNSDICLLLLSKDISPNLSINKVYENILCNNLLIAYEGVNTIDYFASQGIFKTFSRNENDKIIEYINMLIANPDKLQIIKDKCSKISDKYTWEAIEDIYSSLYN